MRRRVTEPRVPVDHCDRPELIQRCTLDARPVTLVMAPGGFGKTALLAACCETARAAGVPTAWLTLSSEDTAAVLDRYVAYALEEAGIGPAESDALAPHEYDGPYPRTSAALFTLEARDQPCVLVLDELERVTDPACAALLGFVLRGAPGCLRLALSCRELPAGLDAAAAIFGAEAEVVAVDDLRFSPEEISRFFDLALSRSELAAAVEETAGWPIALRMWRAERAEDGPERGRALVARDIFENWIEGRLLADFVDRERELLLDISLFDPVDAALVDDVLEQPGAMDGLLRIPGLAGLITRTGSGGRAYRMHPLLRRYCERRRRRAPDRYRKLQRRIAVAMARRNKTVAAMRHAVAADDPVLGGRLLADAGAPRVWLQQGADQLLAADRLLTDAAVAVDVRLALVRCIAQAVSGDLVAARRTFASAAPGLNAAAANGDGLDVEVCLVRGTLIRNGCESVGAPGVQRLMAEVQRAADKPTMPAVVRGTMEYGLCIYRGLRAEFESARQHGARARALVLERSPYVRMVVDFQCGQVAMAQGRTQEAAKFYRNGREARRLPGTSRFGTRSIRVAWIEPCPSSTGFGNGHGRPVYPRWSATLPVPGWDCWLVRTASMTRCARGTRRRSPPRTPRVSISTARAGARWRSCPAPGCACASRAASETRRGISPGRWPTGLRNGASCAPACEPWRCSSCWKAALAGALKWFSASSTISGYAPVRATRGRCSIRVRRARRPCRPTSVRTPMGCSRTAWKACSGN